jgi:succinate dehydrogenase hydrophobic membrane anchor protein
MISMLERIPKISFCARTRGWHFVIAWGHRVTGILLVIFVWIHIYSFSTPFGKGVQDVKTEGLVSLISSLFQWLLAVPIIFHAFNGGRLILYEIFGSRRDESMLRWMTGLAIIYLSPFIFWLLLVAVALILSYGVGARNWRRGHSILWELQRVTATFLLVMVPSYLLFMHLIPTESQNTGMVIPGMQRVFIQGVYLLLLVATLYHAGYGIWSLVSDYLSSRTLRTGLALLVTLVMLVFSWVGVRSVLGIQ